LIFGPDGDRIEIGSADNSNGYANTFSSSQTDSPDSTFAVPASGTYTIVATTDNAVTGTTGPDNPAYNSALQSNLDTFDYELRLHEFAGEATPIEYNSSINGTLSAQSNFNDALNGYYDVYSFDAEQGDRLSVEMRPEGGPYNATHAARFLIFGPDGDRIAIGSPSNANGYADSYGNFQTDYPDSTFSVSTSGTYTIVATTDNAATGTTEPDPAYETDKESNSDTFAYEFRLHEFTGEPTSIQYDSPIDGSLTTQSNFNDALNGYYDVYSFDAKQSGDIWAELSVAGGSNPESHATRLEIYGPSGQRVAFDSTENGTSSISSTSVSTGEHTVVVTTTDSGFAVPYDTDQESQTATYNYQISVTDGPTAAFNASTTGDGSIQFDAESSSLPGGEITQYEWDFDEDGDIESSGETATYTYNTSGEYNVTLTVTAASGATDTITKTATSAGVNTAPTAAFTYSPSTPEVGDTVRFDANQSSDPDGTIANFNWDLNGDGSNDAAGVTTTQTYEEPGIYNVTLSVTDNGDKNASITQPVRVTESSGPGDVTGTGNKAKDPDNDGVYEDINGDGGVDVFDVQALYTNLDTDTVQNYPEAFNFAGDDNPTEVTIFDVQALFRDM
jgi:PKD repeat protein